MSSRDRSSRSVDTGQAHRQRRHQEREDRESGPLPQTLSSAGASRTRGVDEVTARGTCDVPVTVAVYSSGPRDVALADNSSTCRRPARGASSDDGRSGRSVRCRQRSSAGRSGELAEHRQTEVRRVDGCRREPKCRARDRDDPAATRPWAPAPVEVPGGSQDWCRTPDRRAERPVAVAYGWVECPGTAARHGYTALVGAQTDGLLPPFHPG
jgi:hypothetical protein